MPEARIRAAFRKLVGRISIRLRLQLLFAILIAAGTGFTLLFFYQDHSISTREYQIALHGFQDLRAADSLGILLREAHNAPRAEVRKVSVNRFDAILSQLKTRQNDPNAIFFVNQIERDFLSFRNDVRQAPERLESDIAAFSSMKEGQLYESAHAFQVQHSDLARAGVMFLALFILGGIMGASRAISVATYPLVMLVRFLDSVRGAERLPDKLPEFQGNSFELRRLTQSFIELFKRLEAYQAINIRRLLMEKRRTDIIAASIADGIFLLRGDEILYVNPIAEKILALPPESPAKGLVLSDFLHSPSPKAVPGAQAVLSAISRTMPVDFVLEGRDGRKSYYLLQAYPITHEVIEQVEHSFASPADELLDRWQATMLVLASDVTIVRESQEAKSHFIATLSHEVKTPVTSLTMATRLLKKSVSQLPNPTHRALIETCAEDVDRLRGLLEDLLSVSRFDTLTQRLDLTAVDISKLLKQSIQFFQPQAFEKGVEISFDLQANGRPTLIPMDASKISWAISNLMTNALRHTSSGGRIEAALELRDDVVQVRIRDYGPGIEKGRQERIFDKFTPFYDLRVARSGSVGMGLAIAREIIVAHGGRIWVTSEPGKGAEFCFTLPLRRGPAETNVEDVVSSSMKGDKRGASARSG